MPNILTVKDLNEGLQRLSSGRPIKVILTEDTDIDIQATKNGVKVWDSPEKGDSIGNIAQSKVYGVKISRLPLRNENGQIMIPVYWKRTTGWIDLDEISDQIKYVGTVNDAGNGSSVFQDREMTTVIGELATGQQFNVIGESTAKNSAKTPMWIIEPNWYVVKSALDLTE